MPQQTINDWLSQVTADRYPEVTTDTRFPTKPRYHIANCRLEDFEAPSGVTSGQSKGAFQAAYRDKVRMYHPDKATGNRAIFDMVQRAGKELGVA